MYNIHIYSEKLEDDYGKQLLKYSNSILPNDAIHLSTQYNFCRRYIPSIVMQLSVMFFLFCIGAKKISTYHIIVDTDMRFCFDTIVVGVIAFIISPWIHEIIHAVLYPKKYTKYIFRFKTKPMYLTYCNGIVSKRRMIIILLGPFFSLGLVQFYLWYISCELLPDTYKILILMEVMYNIFICVSDLGAALMIFREVPKEAKIIIYGEKIYYLISNLHQY